MKEFTYVIKDEIGIHARPAGNLVKFLKDKKSAVTIECRGKKADAKKIFSLISLAAKCNDEIKVTVDGEDEETVKEELAEYLNKNL